MGSPGRLGALALSLVLLAPATVLGQAGVTGTVRNDSTQLPIMGAEVVIEALGRRTLTDSEGRFALTALPPGLRLVLVRAVGHHALSVMMQFTAGQTLRRDIGLEPMVVELDPIVVEGKPPPQPRGIGREAFEERRRMGFGQFIDSTVLRRSEYVSLGDVLRRHTSVYISQSLFGGGQALSSRYRNRMGSPDCYMQIILDGRVEHPGGRVGADPAAAAAPDLRLLINVGEVESVEVYRSAAETPVEFGGATAACGTIVIWTRRGA